MMHHEQMKAILDGPNMRRSALSLASLTRRCEELLSTCRPVDAVEIERLKANGNSCTNWDELFVGPEFDPARVKNSQLSGRCVLYGFGAQGESEQPASPVPSSFPPGIYSSTLCNCVIDRSVAVYHCAELSGYYVGRGTTLVASRVVAVPPEIRRQTSFPQPSHYRADALDPSLVIEAGIETGGRSVPCIPELTLELAQLIAENPGDPDCLQTVRTELAERDRWYAEAHRFIGDGVLISHCGLLRSTFVAGGTIIDGAQQITESVLLSAPNSVTRVGAAVHLSGVILQEGVTVDSAARVGTSILLSGSGAEEGARVHNCVVACGTVVAGGEATASLIGPFVGFHHTSLLIAAYWPEGRGNIGYGANVGSNHNSRMPDQEIHPGEGMFFGLDSVIKFPAHYRHAPYTVIASGVATLPQRLELPFSLIIDEPSPPSDLPPGLTRVIPAWMLRENLYAVVRSERKLRQRSGPFLPKDFNPSPFRSDIARLVRTAVAQLRAVADLAQYGPRELPAVGKNYLSNQDRLLALTAYEEYLCVVEGRHLLMTIQQNNATVTEEERSILTKLHAVLNSYRVKVVSSRQKDMERGARIISDYEKTHQRPEDEPLIQEFLLETTQQLQIVDSILAQR